MDNSRKYDRDVMKGIFQFVSENPEWSTYLLPPSFIADTKPEVIFKSISNPDGAIVRDYKGWEILKELEIPVILSPFKKIRKSEINLICNDSELGRFAANYYKLKGYRHFAYYGDSRYHWSEKRKSAFKKELSDGKFTYASIPDNYNQIGWSKRFEHLSEWMISQPNPLAVFCATDEFARLIIEAANYANLKCPEDVAVLGVDNDDSVCDLSSPSISSIDQGAVLGGYLAAKRIFQFKNEARYDKENIVTIPRKVVERQSTSIVATDDKEIQKAISFISENAIFKDIRVGDVINSTILSRRLLEKRFQDTLGTSILFFIQQRRITHIKKLLTETTLSIKEIGIQMDFSNFESISRYFKKATSYTPSEYRKKFRF